MKKKEEKKKAMTTEEFMNVIFNYCVLCALTDFSKKDPRKEFKEIGVMVSMFMAVKGWKVK